MRIIRLMCTLLPLVALGQEYRGTVLGRITDASGASVPDASIRITNAETNVSLETKSNDAGNYRIPFVLPGNYTVQAEHAGFKKLMRPDIRVSAGSDTTVDLAMEVGTSSESVTVSAAAEQLNTSSADLGQVIGQAYIGKMSASLEM